MIFTKMSWLWQFFSKLYLNIAKTFGYLSVFMFFTFFILFSAQYIGERIGYKILNTKTIVFTFILDNNDGDVKYHNFVKKIVKEVKLKELNIKTKIVKPTNKKVLSGDFEVIISNNQTFLEDTLSKKGVFRTINSSLFNENSRPFLEFLQNNEYVKAQTHYNTDIYLGISNNLSSIQQSKIMVAVKSFGNFVIKKKLMY